MYQKKNTKTKPEKKKRKKEGGFSSEKKKKKFKLHIIKTKTIDHKVVDLESNSYLCNHGEK